MGTLTMSKSVTAALGAVLVVGCAPDAWTNIKATGFNAFLDQVATECAPLQVGPQVVTVNYQPPNYATDLYDQWFDATSRLYYKKTTPQTYLNDINNYFGDPRTQQSAQCVVSKLPPPEQRPNAPAGRW
jgi:hypothetical protein